MPEPFDWHGSAARVGVRRFFSSINATWASCASASLLFLLGCATLPALARGSTAIVEPPAAQIPYQQWVDAAKVPTPDLQVTVIEEPCPGYLNSNGCTLENDRLYLHPERIGLPSQGPWLFLHEIGHIFDRLYMTDSGRAAFSGIFADTRPWEWLESPTTLRPGPGTIGPPMERFAQAYSECAIKGPALLRRPRHARKYRYRPSPRQHARACALILEAGKRAGLDLPQGLAFDVAHTIGGRAPGGMTGH